MKRVGAEGIKELQLLFEWLNAQNAFTSKEVCGSFNYKYIDDWFGSTGCTLQKEAVEIKCDERVSYFCRSIISFYILTLQATTLLTSHPPLFFSSDWSNDRAWTFSFSLKWHEWVGGWMSEWVDGWMNEWMSKRVDEWSSSMTGADSFRYEIYLTSFQFRSL